MWLYAMQALRCMHAYAMAPHVLLLCRAYQHLDAQTMLGPRIPGSRTLVNLMDHGSTHHQIHHSAHQDLWVLIPPHSVLPHSPHTRIQHTRMPYYAMGVYGARCVLHLGVVLHCIP